MSIEKVARIAEDHGIEYRITGEKIELLEVYTINGEPGEEWKDATRWTLKDLLWWLGY